MSFEQKQYWLKGQEYERERIIKLLEDNYNKWLDREGSIPDETVLEFARLARVSTLEFLIALIKGEE